MTFQPMILPNDHVPENLRSVMKALCTVAVAVADIIALGPLGQTLGAEVGENTDGDQQKALDVLADDMFAAALREQPVRWYASEEQDEVVELNPQGDLALAIDPLDGSSNIDVNVSIGTIFSIYPANENANGSFLRPASEQIAGGYVIYGPQVGLVVTFGDGVQYYVLNRATGQFELVNARMSIPQHSQEFAINASNYRHWSKPVRAYIDHCLAGADGPREQNFNMRWVASLVAETHRILSRGGVFLYPGDARDGYQNGRLRMVYECAPIAFVIEQASGQATDGSTAIMDTQASELHARTPLVFGSSVKVARVASYHNLPPEELSELHDEDGLFRAR